MSYKINRWNGKLPWEQTFWEERPRYSEDGEDFDEEDEEEDLDRQLDAEDAAEAMEDLHHVVEAEQEGERTTIAQLLQSSGALPTAALYP